MKLFSSTAALLLLLARYALADACYYCENYPHVGAVYPTYDCGKHCGLNNYNTYFSDHHCWEDSDGAGGCYANCCADAGRDATSIDL